MAYQLVTSVALGVTVSVVARTISLRHWWMNLFAMPALGVASTAGSLLGSAVLFRGWYALTKRRASNDLVMNGRILGGVAFAIPLRSLLARFLVDRAWPRFRLHPSVWGVLLVPLLVALAAIDESAAETEVEHDRQRRDPLTGARSDRALTEDITALQAAHIPFSLVAFDLDGFKGVNDRLGHIAADDVLVDIVKRLMGFEPDAITYRPHGDEFVLVAAGTDDRLEELVRSTSAAIRDAGESAGVVLSASFGASGAVPGEAERDLRKRADDAATLAKCSGKARLIFEEGRVVALDAAISPEKTGACAEP